MNADLAAMPHACEKAHELQPVQASEHEPAHEGHESAFDALGRLAAYTQSSSG